MKTPPYNLLKKAGKYTLSCFTSMLVKEEQHLHISNCGAIVIVALTVFSAFNTSWAATQDSQLQSPILTRENKQLVIFDQSLKEHTFIHDGNGTLEPQGHDDGTLTHLNGQLFIWIDNDGKHHHFDGSYVTGTKAFNAAAECVPLQETPALTAPELITDAEAEAEADTETVIDSQTNEPDAEPSPEESQCDTQANGSHTFSGVDLAAADLLLDARPASCESYFVQYYGTQRGSEIESGLFQHSPYSNMTPTLRTFPVVDFITDNALYVVHSRDLGSLTFNSPNQADALFNQLLEDGEEIQTRFIDVLQSDGSITASELGNSTTINRDQLRPIVMQLVIRDGIASASHWQQIENARQVLQDRYNITLEIVVIP